MIRASLLLIAACVLAGCALFPLTEADCRPPSWRQRGYDDGFSGSFAQDLRFIRECGRMGIAIDRDEYLAGWAEGHNEWDRLIGSRARMR